MSNPSNLLADKTKPIARWGRTQATYPATAPILNGTYRVRINASVDSNAAPFYTLISATEDLEGVFTVVP